MTLLQAGSYVNNVLLPFVSLGFALICSALLRFALTNTNVVGIVKTGSFALLCRLQDFKLSHSSSASVSNVLLPFAALVLLVKPKSDGLWSRWNVHSYRHSRNQKARRRIMNLNKLHDLLDAPTFKFDDSAERSV